MSLYGILSFFFFKTILSKIVNSATRNQTLHILITANKNLKRKEIYVKGIYKLFLLGRLLNGYSTIYS